MHHYCQHCHTLQAAFNLQHVRLWDLPAATRTDALVLCRRERVKLKADVRDNVLDEIRARPVPEDAEEPCECEVLTENMLLSRASWLHLAENERVVIDKSNGNQPDACSMRDRMMAQMIGAY